MKFVWTYEGVNYSTTNLSYLTFGNFAEPSKAVSSIAVVTEPNKMSYNQGETVDLTGGKLTVTYEDSTTEEIDMTSDGVSIISGSPATIKVVKSSGERTISILDSMISGYDANKSGEQAVTVTYGGKSTNFLVTVGEKLGDITPETTPKDTSKDKKPTNNQNVTPVVPEEPVDEEPTPVVPQKPTTPEEPKKEEKPTATLGAQDKNQLLNLLEIYWWN